MAELRSFNERARSELEEIHAEKRKMLIDQETRKLQQYDDEYSKVHQVMSVQKKSKISPLQVMAEFRERLRPRKMALEEQFHRELLTHAGFYGDAAAIAGASSASGKASLNSPTNTQILRFSWYARVISDSVQC